MRTTTSVTLAAMVFAALINGCSKETAGSSGSSGASGPSSGSSAPAASAASAAAPAPAASSAPAPGTTPAASHDCPKGSAGEGSFDKPCAAASKNARLMEATWTGKTDDKGPQFRVVNKSSLTILYGKIAVYFYDKAGKQLDVQDTAATPPKAVPYRTCSGNIFGGVMKPAEKAVITFSCVKKEHVPEGTAAIEAELQSVGFADPTEKKVDFYWTNKDLVLDARKKGGVK
jgi:hypothetical protein